MIRSKTFWITWIVVLSLLIALFGYLSSTATIDFELNTDPELPTRIVIEKANIDVTVVNPESDSIPILDESLKLGAVRHPESGKLGERGSNVFIFGHSSGLPVVINQNYKAFNNLQTLSEGDTITVFSDNREYTYVVETVRLTTADEAFISFKESHASKLTLSTCNSFGTAQERYVVEAIRK